MPKLGRFLSGQIVANTELQNKQDLPTVFGPCFSYNPHYCFVCGLIHYEADVTVWKSSIVGVNA